MICLQEVVFGDTYHFYDWGGYKGEMNTPIISEKEFPGELGKIYDFNWSKASDLYVHQPETNYGFGNAVLVNNKVCSDIKQKQMVYNNLDFRKAPPDSEEKRSAAISVFKKNGFDIADYDEQEQVLIKLIEFNNKEIVKLKKELLIAQDEIAEHEEAEQRIMTLIKNFLFLVFY